MYFYNSVLIAVHIVWLIELAYVSDGFSTYIIADCMQVTSAISAPIHKGFLAGISTQFSTGSMHRMESGSIQKDAVALHLTIRRLPNTSISTQIAALRRLLFKPSNSAIGFWFGKIVEVK